MKDVFRNPVRCVANVGQVDLEKVKIGDKFSFIYSRGSRAGQRRTVTLREIKQTGHGLLMVCLELDGASRDYYPSLSAATRYPGDPEDDEVDQGVPLFDARRAVGNAGHWNFVQPQEADQGEAVDPNLFAQITDRQPVSCDAADLLLDPIQDGLPMTITRREYDRQRLESAVIRKTMQQSAIDTAKAMFGSGPNWKASKQWKA